MTTEIDRSVRPSHFICPVCRKTFGDETQFLDARGTVMHWSCHMENKDKRINRFSAKLNRGDVLKKLSDEIKCLVSERNAIRADKDAEMKRQVDMVERIRRMSLWSRLKFLFNPFGY